MKWMLSILCGCFAFYATSCAGAAGTARDPSGCIDGTWSAYVIESQERPLSTTIGARGVNIPVKVILLDRWYVWDDGIVDIIVQ